ncbi:MAG: LysM peptidoglycan-binding domain-containing protein [bacterium]
MVKIKRAVIWILVASMVSVTPGVSYSKITQKYKDSDLIIIKKGDTLWDLAGYYYRQPYLWPKFKQYNIFTDPHWIYPGEKLAIGREKASQLCAVLQAKINEMEKEKEKNQQKISELELEIKRLKDEGLVVLLQQKESELVKIQQQVSSKDEENEMLKSAILELQMKLVESQATINMQAQQIDQLIKVKNVALNAGYFLGFAVISTLLAGEVVK